MRKSEILILRALKCQTKAVENCFGAQIINSVTLFLLFLVVSFLKSEHQACWADGHGFFFLITNTQMIVGFYTFLHLLFLYPTLSYFFFSFRYKRDSKRFGILSLSCVYF